MRAGIILCFALALASGIDSAGAAQLPSFEPCSPSSDYIDSILGEPNAGFCSEWNPEYGFKGTHCCAKLTPRGRKRRAAACAPHRARQSYCDEMTEAQRAYSQAAADGKLADVLELIERESQKKRDQSFCSPNTGFLAWGRRIVPTERNRIHLLRPDRCANFATDGMVGLLEWVGRRVADRFPASEYPQMRLLLGDVSAPRGGCLSGRGGGRGHSSHTSGIDADVGFISTSVKVASDQRMFIREFDPKLNWWFVKEIFHNPYACVKAMFLDRRLIAKLRKAAAGDPDWDEIGRYIKHVRGHRSHFHVRVGNQPGSPGCPAEPMTDGEEEDEWGGDSMPLDPESRT